MAVTMHVDIASQEGLIYSGLAEMLAVEGVNGAMGIFPFHAPLLSELVPGPVRIVKREGDEEIIFVSGGILEVQPDIVTILADTVIRGDDLTEAAAEAAQERAKQALADNQADIDYGHAQAELLRAAAMLKTIRQIKSHIR